MKWPAAVAAVALTALCAAWTSIAGFHARAGRARFSAGLRWHDHAAPFGRFLEAAGGSAPALPAGARVVPQDYGIRSEHPLGFVLLAAWEFWEAV